MSTLRMARLCRLPTKPRVTPSLIGSRPFSRLNRASPASEIVKALGEDGCVVIESILAPAQVARLNADMDAALASLRPGRPANANTEALPDDLDASVFGENSRRLGGIPNLSAAFREDVADNETIHAVSKDIFQPLGDYWLSTAQMIEIGPGSKAQPLHADASGWWPFWAMGEQWTPEFAVNFLIATTDTTRANGATGVVRDSHKIKYSDAFADPTFSCWKFPDEKVEQIELKAGDCLLLGGRIVHRGEENKTANEFRRILSCTVVSAALTPEEAHPLLMDTEHAKALTERAKSFLGFREMKTSIGPDVWQNHQQGGLKRTLGY